MLDNLSTLLLDPAFQQQIQTQLRREAAAYNTCLTYRDEQGRHIVEYPGSGQLYEQTEDRQLLLLSVAGQAVAPVAPISWVEAKHRQATN
ncbi:hypothetical protein [Hymenobacter bucti]|uniref:Uncharacterized protein n=1 Tax=Hymenobacter bucti TaxID=1844114 RepID=A0ABW4R042_9BACT